MGMEITLELRERLEGYRKSRMLSQRQTARECGVHESTYGRWIDGKGAKIEARDVQARVRELARWSPTPKVGEKIWAFRASDGGEYIGTEVGKTEGGGLLIRRDIAPKDGDRVAVELQDGRVIVGKLHWVPAIEIEDQTSKQVIEPKI